MRKTGVLHGEARFRLVLPREALSVPVMRRVLGGTLVGYGADEDCVADILLAATEACANVLRHGGGSDRYEVSARVGKDACQVRIIDGMSPNGFWPGRLRGGLHRRGAIWPGHRTGTQPGQEAARDIPESGRGLTIIRACMDDMSMHGTTSGGTVVLMRRRITRVPQGSQRRVPGPRSRAELREAG